MKISFVVDPHQKKNKIFNFSAANPVNRDDGVYPFFKLKELLEKNGHSIDTDDILDPKLADAVLFLDFPQNFSKYNPLKNKYLMITESEVIKPNSWIQENHQHFKKIFTWKSDLIDQKKYFKLNFSHKIKYFNLDQTPRNKFCCLIAGAKKNAHPLELYSERVTAIRWFEKNHPDEFDLYGMGWDHYTFQGPKIWRSLNKVKFLTTYLAPHFPSYKGKIDSKLATLKNYTYSICYENAHSIPGYVTEKIFDCFFSGCIPIYLGAPDIYDFIPENCMIHKKDFKTYADLYTHLKSLSFDQIQTYQRNILKYLNSPEIHIFSADYFAKTISDEITKY